MVTRSKAAAARLSASKLEDLDDTIMQGTTPARLELQQLVDWKDTIPPEDRQVRSICFRYSYG